MMPCPQFSPINLGKSVFVVAVLIALAGCSQDTPPVSVRHTRRLGTVPVGHGSAFSLSVAAKDLPIALFFDAANQNFKAISVSLPSSVHTATVLPANTAAPQGNLAASIGLSSEGHLHFLCGQEKLTLVEGLLTNSLISEKMLSRYAIPELQGLRIQAVWLMSDKHTLNLIATKQKTATVLYAVDCQNAEQRSGTVEGGPFAAALHAGILRVGVIHHASEDGSRIRFYDIRSDDRLLLTPNEWPVLNVPTFVQKIALAGGSDSMTVIAIGGFAIYECVLSDSQWQVTVLSHEKSRIGPGAAIACARRAMCVLYQPLEERPRLLIRKSPTSLWERYTLAGGFPKYVFQADSVMDSDGNLYTLTAEGNSGTAFVQDLVLRQWVFRKK